MKASNLKNIIRKKNTISKSIDDESQPQIMLWVLRLLFRGGLHNDWILDKKFFRDGLGRYLGYGPMLDDEPDASAYDRKRILAELRKRWKDLECIHATHPESTEVSKTIDRLGKQLGFNQLECDVLSFRLACEISVIRDLAGHAFNKTFDGIVRLLAACLDYPGPEIRNSLKPEGALLQSGIISINMAEYCFDEAFSILECIIDEIHLEHDDPLTYFRSRITKVDPARLAVNNFPHVGHDIQVLVPYLKQAIMNRQIGVNVLIHGEPGSGKTEFVRMVASCLDMDLYAVASCTRDEQILSGDERFRAYRLSQKLFEKSQGQMMLFDEIEDVFLESDRDRKSNGNRSQKKAWVNQLLEKNPVPTFWISNNICMMDRAFLRRFDYVLEMNAPPRSVRRQILDSYLADIPVSEGWKQKMAEHEGLVPAVVERAAKVVGLVKDVLPHEEVERSMARVMGNSLEVMGMSREPKNWSPMAGNYRLDVLNTDCIMEDVCAGLVEHQQGRVCLYGPPGTGKSAFGRHVAETLDRPLMVRRASDIISMWVGGTEKNLARMFREAAEEEAVLLLDEADSFLQDRQSARNSWEITGVNEMLTQMEGFQGLFIASTNLMGCLDSAALRRFDLKIKFDFMRTEQAWIMFQETAASLSIDQSEIRMEQLSRLKCLTPGDFANVCRQTQLRRIKTSTELFHRLEAECEAKPEGQKRTIGFA